jgi:hypothetical protein
MANATVTLPTAPVAAPATPAAPETVTITTKDGKTYQRRVRGSGTSPRRARAAKGMYFVITEDTFDSFTDSTKAIEFLQGLGDGAAKAHVILGRELGLVMRPTLGEKK